MARQEKDQKDGNKSITMYTDLDLPELHNDNSYLERKNKASSNGGTHNKIILTMGKER